MKSKISTYLNSHLSISDGLPSGELNDGTTDAIPLATTPTTEQPESSK